jgi:putative transposase
MLTERKEVYEQYKEEREALTSHQFKSEKDYKSDFEFLKEVDSIALQQSRKNLITAYTNFFRSSKAGYPKFKSKKAKQSYTTINVNQNIKIDFQNRTIKLPKMRTPIKYKDERNFDEPIRKVTLSRTKTGKYYVSILIERELPVKTKQVVFEDKIGAYDMSVSAFLVSDTEKLENQRFYRTMEKKIRRLQRALARKQPGSHNWKNAKLTLARLYEKIHNRKLDWTHKITFKLSRTFDAICLEDLNIKGMQQFNSGVSKSVTLDFSWRQFVTLLKYKLEWQGKHLILIDRFFPSSKTCSMCGYINHALELKDRTWLCLECDTVHERDPNAAVNIRTEGKRILREDCHVQILNHSTAGMAESYASGENVSLLPKQFSRNEESSSFKRR